MLDDKQSSIIRPKAVPSMFTPVLTPNTQSSTMNNNNNNTNRTSQQALIEMSTMIRKHDSDASRLYDCIGQVKVFAYNSIDLRWENSPNIEGNLCAYERQTIINNKTCPGYAFAIINGDKSLIQPITSDMVQHADKLRLFYEVARNGRREVFCLHFLTEPECLRLHTFFNRCIQFLRNLAEQQQQQPPPPPPPPQQQARPIQPPVPIDSQTQLNGQMTSTMPVQQILPRVYPHQLPQQHRVMIPKQTSPIIPPQFGSPSINLNQTPTRVNASSILAAQHQPQQINPYPLQMPIDLMSTNLIRLTPTVPSPSIMQVEAPKPIEQIQFPPSPIPLTNGNNNNSEDPTSSLKRLLNIRGQSDLENLSLDDGPIFPKQAAQQNLLDLMPPSAFEPITATPPSPVVAIGAERVKHRLSTQLTPMMTREHFRNVLLHLVQNDDHFLDIIYQACLTYPPTSQ